MKLKFLKKSQRYKILIHLLFILLSFCFILPIIMVISISLSSEAAVTALDAGYSLLPRDFSTAAYEIAFDNPRRIVSAYIVTAFQAIGGTMLSVFVCGMVAYSLSRSNFAYKDPIAFVIFFTMLFNGGLIPTYIIYTKYYHLGDTIWIYILPGIAGGAWNTLMIRTFFKGLSESLFEAARIDGAGEFKIFWKIALPLSKPVFATVGFMSLVGKWNDWNTSLVYIRNEDLYTLQYLLQRILNESELVKKMAQGGFGMEVNIDISSIISAPVETLRYALCVIAAGPMLIVFPFFQKYFVKGTTIGAVKG